MKTPIYWIDGPWPGRVGIMPRPRGGDWLEEEIQAWRDLGVHTLVSTLTEDEITDLDLAQEAEICRRNGVEYLNFPIMDRGMPDSEKMLRVMAETLAEKLGKGQNVAIHCRQGIGRSSLLAACVLSVGGMDTATAFGRIGASRGCAVPETPEQEKWVAEFVRKAMPKVVAR